MPTQHPRPLPIFNRSSSKLPAPAGGVCGTGDDGIPMVLCTLSTYAASFGIVQSALSSAGDPDPCAASLHTGLYDLHSMALLHAGDGGPLLQAIASFLFIQHLFRCVFCVHSLYEGSFVKPWLLSLHLCLARPPLRVVWVLFIYACSPSGR